MNKIITAGCMAVATLAAAAMPTKTELERAKPVVENMTKADLAAYRAGEKTAQKVAAAHVAYAQKAEGEAAKYLLYQGAFKLYARCGEYDLAAEAIGAMKREIKDLPPEVIAEIVGDELRYVSDDKAPHLVAILKESKRAKLEDAVSRLVKDRTTANRPRQDHSRLAHRKDMKDTSQLQATVDGYTWWYRVDNGEATIEAKKDGKFVCAVSPSPKGAVSIPTTINGVKVTSIGENAFAGCKELTSVKIPEGVTIIGAGAFGHCEGLKSALIPSSVKRIGRGAFFYCFKLESVTIPEGVECIEQGTFQRCYPLTTVTIPSSVKRIENNAFLCCGLKSVVIPNGVVKSGAFGGCAALATVVLSSSATNVEAGAFSQCGALVSYSVDSGNPVYSSRNGMLCSKDGSRLVAGVNSGLAIPAGVTSLAEGAFVGLSSVKSVTIPPSVTNIEVGAFAGTISIRVDEGNAHYKSAGGLLLTKDGTTLVRGVGGEVIIPKGVTNIVNGAFGGCDVKTVKMPSSVKSFGSALFYCGSLESIAISENVTDIGGGAFQRCARLKTLEIPKGVTRIGRQAFFCSGLESVTVPARVNEIGHAAFYGCGALASVTMLGERPKAPVNDLFNDCPKLKEIHVPANAKSWAGMKDWQGKRLVFDAEVGK